MSDVIDIRSARGKKPPKDATTTLTVKKSRHNRFSCRHGHLVVDEETRTIVCTSCKAVLDPFLLFCEMAEGHRHVAGWRANLSRLRCELDDLNRQIRNAKARLKRAQRKNPRPDGRGST